jgi:hypothetical protein
MILIPHIKFIESLVMSKYTLDQIVDKLKELKIATDDEVLGIIIKTLRQKYPAFFHGKEPEPITPQWLMDEMDIIEAYSYLRPEDDFSDYKFTSLEKAVRLLDDPLMYRIITSLAFANVEKEEIELITQAKFNLEYSSEDLQLFLKYFFNVKNWTRRQRQTYIDRISDKNLNFYYKLALKGDKEFLMWKLGITPGKDFKDMLVEMTNDSFYNFKEQSGSRPESAQRWAQLSTKLMEKLEQLERKDEKDAKNFLGDIEFKIKAYAVQKDIQPEFKHFKDLED